jgi:hypothetical protein
MARPAKNVTNPILLSAALEGLELQKQRIDDQIREVRALLGNKRANPTPAPSVSATDATAERKPRQMSEAARKRIAAAQKKRWANFRKKEAAAQNNK